MYLYLLEDENGNEIASFKTNEKLSEDNMNNLSIADEEEYDVIRLQIINY